VLIFSQKMSRYCITPFSSVGGGMPFAVFGGLPWAMRWILRTRVIRTNTTDRLAPPMPPDSGIAGRLSGRLLDLADQVRRLDPSGAA
jgi:hypothetical protein